MIYLNRKGKREMLRCYLYYIDGFGIEWRQGTNAKAEIVGIGTFNQQKIISKYRYEKKGFGSVMKKRILNLSKSC